MILRPSPVAISTFTWDPRTRTLSAEASDLPAPERVYDDACDVGYTVLGDRAEVVFVEHEEHRDQEGDITHWTFVPASTLARTVRGQRPNVMITVWND